MEKPKYSIVPKDDMESFLDYLKASLNQAEHLKSYIFRIYSSLDESSFEEHEYDFLSIRNLSIMDEKDLLLEIWHIFEKYNKMFDRMVEQSEKDDVNYSTRLKYTLQNSRVLMEHVSSWLEKTPEPDDIPKHIWTFKKSDALVRDITILKTYIKHLKLILECLNKLKYVQMFHTEDFVSSNGI